MDIGRQLASSQDISTKVALVFQKRAKIAQDRLGERLRKAYDANGIGEMLTNPAAAAKVWTGHSYAVDSAQRSILFWDTIRQRGNMFLQRTIEGLPPVLHFKYETVLDARKFARPVNYALVRIVPPEGVVVDPKRRPYVVIDPRAGHGPGIGGFKDDSQVGVALREGHPVYFVIFFRIPSPARRCSTSAKPRSSSSARCGSCIRTAGSLRSWATARVDGPR